MTGHVIRTHKTLQDPFAQIPNHVLNNKDMSWEARGMLSYLLSKPSDWLIMFRDLVNKSPCGEDRTRRILKELERAGYVRRTKLRRANGKFYWESEIFDQPYWVANQILRRT